MSSVAYLLAIDQGTTSSRAVVFDARTFHELGSAQQEITQYYPQPGWVEHDVEEIWSSVAQTIRQAIAKAQIDPTQIVGIGITNQRETVVLWDRSTGQPVGKAIVWQDRRTTSFCRSHEADQPMLQDKTGLVLDPYFSATKIHWMLEENPALKSAAQNGAIACGTIDSFLLNRLTGGKVHVTDVTNASRTLLLNIRTLSWDEELCSYFAVPREMLPDLGYSVAGFGSTKGLDFLPDGIKICGMAGDQQAALFGQCAFQAGEAKCTYGTGAFFLLHTGNHAIASQHRLLTTVAATIAGSEPQYALEGAVFIAGAAVQWLRDGLHLFRQSSDIEGLATQADLQDETIFVPAFVGLGSPYWVPEARGAMFGLSRGTSQKEMARATLEGVAFQVMDLIEAARKDLGVPLPYLRVDGGMARNDWFLQCQANTLGIPVHRSPYPESTALGAGFLAGIGAGIWKNETELRTVLSQAQTFDPQTTPETRQHRYRRWTQAIHAVIHYAQTTRE